MDVELHLVDTAKSNENGSDKAPPLVILHGLFGSADNWRSHIKHWQVTRRVIAVDLRNHGRSTHAKGMGYEAMADDVLGALDLLGIERFDLLGHSMGGKVAMTMARRVPQRIEHLIVADIAPIAYKHGHETIFQAMRRVEREPPKNRKEADSAMAEFIESSATRMFLATNLVRNEQGELSWRVGLDNIEQDYDSIVAAPGGTGAYEGKALVLRGGRSDYVSDDTLSAVKQVLPQAKIVTLKEAGHWLHAEQPERFQEEVEAFLD
ncbi:alpha/beta fold hydrolase [Phytohalomonas tamaricis]|uniref:alpha/beta fold hydrolase n=1 Tax=Phytohalomonas tamaricis TaxID=2081032 RepID=UPI000D0B9683|nr:alpha/beta fold hydrolase [Phytohalomonas tamaricis]